MPTVASMPRPSVSSTPASPGWPGSGTAARSGGIGTLAAAFAATVVPLLAASVLGALTLHLLSQLAAELPRADALGALSVVAGMAVVLATLLPFTLLWIRRTRRAWTRVWTALPRR